MIVNGEVKITYFIFVGWSKYFSRAPADSSSCLDACYFGCSNRKEDTD